MGAEAALGSARGGLVRGWAVALDAGDDLLREPDGGEAFDALAGHARGFDGQHGVPQQGDGLLSAWQVGSIGAHLVEDEVARGVVEAAERGSRSLVVVATIPSFG